MKLRFLPALTALVVAGAIVHILCAPVWVVAYYLSRVNNAIVSLIGRFGREVFSR